MVFERVEADVLDYATSYKERRGSVGTGRVCHSFPLEGVTGRSEMSYLLTGIQIGNGVFLLTLRSQSEIQGILLLISGSSFSLVSISILSYVIVL